MSSTETSSDDLFLKEISSEIHSDFDDIALAHDLQIPRDEVYKLEKEGMMTPDNFAIRYLKQWRSRQGSAGWKERLLNILEDSDHDKFQDIAAKMWPKLQLQGTSEYAG